MYKLAVIGDESVYGFRALGLDVFCVQTQKEAAARLKTLAEAGYGVIYITEALAAALEAEISAYDTALLPAVVPIPGAAGSTGFGAARITRAVERAVGADIL